MRFKAEKHATHAEFDDHVYDDAFARPWLLYIDGECVRTKQNVGKRFKTEEAALKAGRAHFTRPVTKATRSPMNKLRWSCDLACGHETWVTSTRKPDRAFCETCATSK